MEAGVGRDGARAEEGVGDAGRHRGTRTHGRFLLRRVLRSVGRSVGRSRDLHPPQCVCWAGSGLGLSAPHLPAWEEKSMQLPPSPTPRHRRPPQPPPAPTRLLHTHGRDPRCTHCKKCTFRGRGGEGWSGETQSPPRKGIAWSLHPPSPERGGPATSLAGGGGRWEVRASGLKCLTPAARPLAPLSRRGPEYPHPLPHNLATSSH